jgi:hypothetical protein
LGQQDLGPYTIETPKAYIHAELSGKAHVKRNVVGSGLGLSLVKKIM